MHLAEMLSYSNVIHEPLKRYEVGFECSLGGQQVGQERRGRITLAAGQKGAKLYSKPQEEAAALPTSHTSRRLTSF
jgi:hypothetical protein